MTSTGDEQRPASRLWLGAALSLAYVIAGRFGLMLAVSPGYATAIFPSSGIAVAGMLVAGPATLPWTFLGSLLLNLWIGYGATHQVDAGVALLALGIASASTAQAALGGWALRRWLRPPAALDNGRDLAIFLGATPLFCLISATLSLSAMRLLAAIEPREIMLSWVTWWIGDTLGVLMLLPLTLVAIGKPRAIWRSRAWPVALPMAVFFALFVGIFIRVSSWENEQALVEFKMKSQEVVEKLQAQFTAQQIFLEQMSRSFGRPSPMSRADFHNLAQPLLSHFPFIQAIEWAPRVTAAERPAFEAAQRQQLPRFVMRERNAQDELAPATPRAEYYPVTFVEPPQGNEHVFGADLASENFRLEAIKRAIQLGTVIAAEPMRLRATQTPQLGVRLIAAVPGGGNGPGILMVAIRADPLMRSLLDDSIIEAQLADLDNGRALFNSLSDNKAATPFKQPIEIGGRHYAVMTAPTALYLEQHRQWQSLAVLVAGVLSTSLLGALLLLGTGERRRFARLLAERTRERDRIWQVSEELLGVGNFDGYFLSINPAWTNTLGWGEDEIKKMHVRELRHPDDTAASEEGRRQLAAGITTVRMENRLRHKDGSWRWLYWTLKAENGLIYVVGRDVTTDKQASETLRQTEEQLHQLQKMESIGQLTGGIAHDFNNLLTVIIGNLEVIQRSIGAATQKVQTAIAAALSGATRAVTLTQRLLAYAQKQPLKPDAVDANDLISGMADLVRRTQGETIEFDFKLAPDAPHCFCDGNQLETALLNLVINARDAMPHGGTLTIETGRTTLDSVAARQRKLPPGAYLSITVRDTGTGMSPETAAHAFEPFFTTKDVGKGTGLGLSMVYGFIKQSKGHVEIEGVLGEGTAVRIFLPEHSAGDEEIVLADAPPAEDSVAAEPPTPSGGHGKGETILVAEDNPSVREYVTTALKEMNYAVLEVGDAAAALAVLAQPTLRVDLLLSDIVMPGVNGRELARQARTIQPHIKVLLMTGYSQDAIAGQSPSEAGIELIQKPFISETLAAKIRAMLDRKSFGAAAAASGPARTAANEKNDER